MNDFRRQAELTLEEIKRPRMKITNQPNNYHDLSPAERHSWVCQELASGKYVRSDEISIATLLTLGSQADYRNADYIMYKVLLSEVDPAIAAEKVDSINHAKFFIECYGLEKSTAFLDDGIWFCAFSSSIYTKEQKATKLEIKKLLQHRGAERVSKLIRDKKDGPGYVEIFGLDATNHLPESLANQARGRYLEESLGL